MPTLYSRPNDSPRSSSRRFCHHIHFHSFAAQPGETGILDEKIMRNLALQYLNHANANPTIPLTDIPEEEEPAENPFCPDFISYDKMLDIVESLPEGYCKVFKLAVLEGLSHKEIGDLLGIAPHSSSSQLFRAKILLKRCWQDTVYSLF